MYSTALADWALAGGGGLTPSAEMQSVYSTAPGDWAGCIERKVNEEMTDLKMSPTRLMNVTRQKEKEIGKEKTETKDKNRSIDLSFSITSARLKYKK